MNAAEPSEKAPSFLGPGEWRMGGGEAGVHAKAENVARFLKSAAFVEGKSTIFEKKIKFFRCTLANIVLVI